MTETDEKTPPETREQENQFQMRIAVFWDFENCQPPSGVSGFSVVQDLRKSLLEFGSIRQIRAYADLNLVKSSMRMELQRSGIELLDVPSRQKDASDKMLITDMMAFALDNQPPQRIVIISGDQDFAYTLGRLRNIGYEIILVIPPVGAHPSVRAQADMILDWRDVVHTKDEQLKRPNFEPLLEILKDLWERGEKSPLLTLIGDRLTKRYPAWREKTGQQKLKDYVVLARSEGLVKTSGKHPKFRVELSKEPTKLREEITEEDRFTPLISILNRAHSQGAEELELAPIGIELRSRDADWQATLGVRKLKDYVLEAESENLVVIRSEGLQNYVKLK